MDDDKPLSDNRVFALAKSTLVSAALCGVIAAGFAWFNGLRWYWILGIGFAVYVVAGLIQGVGLALLAKKRREKTEGPSK